ncbi:hypothetical protein CDD83_4678 [Cordyceps sp. RAO-2017]|nr:hypothetical protein CDD83_4678 [Cordyceps sp. RAO-2017]
MTSSFLANGTASRAIKSVTGGDGSNPIGGLTANVDVGRIANGLARGLLAGAGNGVQALGGVDAIISGNAAVPSGDVPDSPLAFNDSVGGAATGFGQGLGSSGVLLAQKLLARGANSSPSPAAAANGSATKTKRGIDSPDRGALVVRQDGGAGGLNISNVLNADAISAVIQKVVEVLGCEGVGGLALILTGLSGSGTVSSGGFDQNTTDFIKSVVPQGIIRFTNDRNVYDVDGKKLTDALSGSLSGVAKTAITINGHSFGSVVAFLVVHIAFAIMAFAVVFPLILILNSSRNILLRVNMAHVLPAWAVKFAKVAWIVGILPSFILVLVFGVLPAAQSAHFRTAHGVLGLLTLLLSLAAAALYLLSSRGLPPAEPKTDRIATASHLCNQILLSMSLFTLVTGFADLNSITLCLTRVVSLEQAVSIGLGVGSLMVIAQLVSGLDLVMLVRMGKNQMYGQEREARAQAFSIERKPLHSGEKGSAQVNVYLSPS